MTIPLSPEGDSPLVIFLMAASPSSSGASRSANARPARGRSRFALIFWLILFAGGFYCGIATARWALHGPDYARKILDLPNPSAPAPVANVAPTVVSPPSAPAPSPPAAQPGGGVTTLPPGSNPVTPPSAPAGTGTPADTASNSGDSHALPAHTEEKKPESAPTPIPTDLKSQIRAYNALLRDVQEQISRQYASEAGNGNVAPTDQPIPPDAIDALRSTIHSAQSIYDVIVADPHFAKQYEEKEAVLPTNAVPPQLVALGPDRLHFIRLK